MFSSQKLSLIGEDRIYFFSRDTYFKMSRVYFSNDWPKSGSTKHEVVRSIPPRGAWRLEVGENFIQKRQKESKESIDWL